MIRRDLEDALRVSAKQLPVVAILGPRQSGKTTLAQIAFPNHTYISLEDLDIRALAVNDPREFLKRYYNQHGVILDEFQHAPDILSYIQTFVDQEKPRGYFILTGSQNFLVNQAISQTLAGRIAIFTLLPLSQHELQKSNNQPTTLDELIFKGSYPRIYAEDVMPKVFYASYTLTYVERDVRQIINVANLATFKNFVSLCAGRIGQLLNVSSLANDCGISVPTANAWLSLLEASYIIYLLQPHYKNFSKRIIKSPKLYFYDTGLACFLLGIESEDQLKTHYLRGGLMENWVITELHKRYYNANSRPRLYFWRDSAGKEIDCIIERFDKLIPIEIKASLTYTPHFFDSILYFNTLAGQEGGPAYVVYAGNQYMNISNLGTLVAWQDIGKIPLDGK